MIILKGTDHLFFSATHFIVKRLMNYEALISAAVDAVQYCPTQTQFFAQATIY